MKPHRKWATLLVLLVLAMPTLANSAGPKKWFHRNYGPSHNYGNHVVVKHRVPKHPKTEPRKSHP